MIEALRNFGASDEQIAEVVSFEKSEDFELWPENFESMQVFLAMSTQWRVGMSGVHGLDYSVIPIIEKRLGLRAKKHVFSGLQILERAVLDLINNGK